MKTKDILLVGAGATIIYLLWRRSKKSKDSKGLVNGIGATTSGTTTGATSSEPEQIYPLQLPPNMDLPNLTSGTGVPTEVAVQQGGVLTTPTSLTSTTPVLSIEDALGGAIKPIKPAMPVYSPCEQKWNDYAQTIRVSSQQAYDDLKADFLMKCEGTTTSTPPFIKYLKDLSVSQDVLPATSEEYSSNIIKNKGDLYNQPATLSANGVNSNGSIINARLYRGVM